MGKRKSSQVLFQVKHIVSRVGGVSGSIKKAREDDHLPHASLPFRFLTPFPQSLARRLRNSPGSGLGFVSPLASPAAFWREKAPLSPFQRSPSSLPPLLGLRPATKRAIPLGTPRLGFRQPSSSLRLILRSSLASLEKPCPLSLRRTSSPNTLAYLIKGWLRHPRRPEEGVPSPSVSGRLNLQWSPRRVAGDVGPSLHH